MQNPPEIETSEDLYVHESRFGKWFLRSKTWIDRVLEIALKDLEGLIQSRRESYPVVVDVGCGYGSSFKKLQQRFSPTTLIGLDIDSEMIDAASAEFRASGIEGQLIQCSSTRIPLEDNSVDLLFCHQTFHHIIEHEKAIAEFYRILKPGGIFLLLSQRSVIFIPLSSDYFFVIRCTYKKQLKSIFSY